MLVLVLVLQVAQVRTSQWVSSPPQLVGRSTAHARGGRGRAWAGGHLHVKVPAHCHARGHALGLGVGGQLCDREPLGRGHVQQPQVTEQCIVAVGCGSEAALQGC